MNCTTCGNLIPPGAANCPSCGMPAPYNPATPTPGASGSGQYPYQNTPAGGAPLPAYPGSQPGWPPPQDQYATYSPPNQPQQPWAPGSGSMPAAGSPGAYTYPGPPTPAPQGPPTRRGLSTGLIILLVVAALALLGGSGLFYYAAVFHPNQLHSEATSTAQAQAQATALVYAQATGTARAHANATAQARASATAQAQATATALQNIYTNATSGNPALNDPLRSNDANNWYEHSDSSGSCTFASGALHATNTALCLARATSFHNFALQARETNIKNGGGSGLIFRTDLATQKAYFFEVSADGNYALFLIKPSAGKTTSQTLVSGTSSAITSGVNQSNLLCVVVRDSSIYMYVNKQFVAQTADATSTTGSIGVFSLTSGSAEEAAFNDVQVWNL